VAEGLEPRPLMAVADRFYLCGRLAAPSVNRSLMTTCDISIEDFVQGSMNLVPISILRNPCCNAMVRAIVGVVS
jgi:hypothetical protein